MRSPTPGGQYGLTYDMRGPEFAVVLPDGDAAALREVSRLLSQMWNGAGTLLLVAKPDGQLQPGLEPSLNALPPDVVLLHPSISEETRHAMYRRFLGRASDWTKDAIERELHWWWLVNGDESQGLATVSTPAPVDDAGLTLASVLWGWIDPDDLVTLDQMFAFEPVTEDDLPITLLRGQTVGASPLAWGGRHTDFTESTNGPSQLGLYVFEDAERFDELVLFWNLPARYPRWGGRTTMVGATMEMIRCERFAESITAWASESAFASKPDVRVSVTADQVDEVRAALTEAGLVYVDSGGKWTSFSVLPEDRRAPEFAFAQFSIPHRLRRGIRTQALVGLREGPNPVQLAAPAALPRGAGWQGLVHTSLQGLPLAFPMSDALASSCLDNGLADGSDAVVVPFGGAVDQLRFELRLPPAAHQLSRHLSSVGLRAETSPAGRLAQALLGRLDSAESLNALASPAAPPLLSSLVARSRKKLAQYVRKELQRAQLATIDERAIVDLLKTEGLFAELDTRTLDQIQGATKLSTETLLPALGPLSDAGFVHRGRALRCPSCRMPDYWRLAELDEQLQCRACLQTVPLPAVENGREAPTAYRLDGLTARAMSQDLLPVLLTLRHLLRRPEATADAQWWPGLDLFESGSGQPDDEVDLLIADQGRLRVCEVKATAPGVTAEGAKKLIATAKRINAEPVIAALEGEWRDEVVELLDEEQFLLLGAGELLEST